MEECDLSMVIGMYVSAWDRWGKSWMFHVWPFGGYCINSCFTLIIYNEWRICADFPTFENFSPKCWAFLCFINALQMWHISVEIASAIVTANTSRQENLHGIIHSRHQRQLGMDF
jgi:hypothetical protein